MMPLSANGDVSSLTALWSTEDDPHRFPKPLFLLLALQESVWVFSVASMIARHKTRLEGTEGK